MPNKTDPRVVVRLSPEDHAKIAEKAQAANLGLATFMRNAALEVKARNREALEAVKAGAEIRVEGGSIAPEKGEPVPDFKCPAYNCDYRARAATAHCSIHGRRVVPI